jgi:microcystin-dependent protein
MAEPFLCEIYIFPFNWPPRGFALCNGQTLPAAQNQALLALMGTFWGGDGRTTVGLPNMSGRVPIFFDNTTIPFASMAGTENVALSTAMIPQHTHTFVASSDPADQPYATGNYLASGVDNSGAAFPTFTTQTSPIVQMSAESCGVTGGGVAHANTQPSLVLNFCIATMGVWPSRNE